MISGLFLSGARSTFRAIAALIAFSCLALAARATSVVPPPFETLVNDSDFIVRAVVKSIQADFSPAGSRNIVSQVELQVTEVIAGKPPQPLVLRVLGGQVGEEEMRIEGAPQFHVGDDNILFVRGNGRLAYPLVAIMHGVYPIMREATTGQEFVARSNAAPLQSAAETGKPMTGRTATSVKELAQQARTALTPADFAQQIRNAVKPDNARLHEK